MPYKLTISNPAEFINNIANLYQTPERIFMEYIDNSIDDAELLKGNKECYPYKIDINIMIDPIRKIVTFLDNCRGMDKDKLLRIVKEIGTSEKKAQPWTNGQFGFGVHAFRACADEMIVISKALGDKPIKIEIERSKNVIEDEQYLEDEVIPYNSGTKVILKNFDSEWWGSINKDTIKNEIETHFEQLLRRKNLEINLIIGKSKTQCRPFNYDNIEGEKIKYNIHEFLRGGLTYSIQGKCLDVYIVITKTIYPNKKVFVSNKGRRIEDLVNIKSYRSKSKYKSSVWDHDNLIGYFEVNGLLEPTIERNDFRPTKMRSHVYQKIFELEEEIYEKIEKINKSRTEENISKFENVLIAALAALAREDNLNFRRENIRGEGIYFEQDPDSDKKIEVTTTIIHSGEGIIEKPSTEEVPVKEVSHKTEITGKKRRKAGFDIKFLHTEVGNITDKDGRIKKSMCVGGTIFIYVKNPKFRERTKQSRKGEFIITDRLISYLSSVIATHYKDHYYYKFKLMPDVEKILNKRVVMFDDYLDFVCRLENMLQPYINKGISTLAEVE